ncbi:MAG TPA: hypothetical protein VGK00_15445 [Anaerolineales bacterium]
MKLTLSYLWKLPLCGIVFFLGMLISAMLLPALGFSAPKMPAGVDANTIVFYFLLSSLLLAFVLSFVSQSLRANWMVRWVILAELSWNFGATGMVIESYFFMNTGAVSSLINALYTLLNFLPPFLLLSALVAALFKPVTPLEPCLDCLRVYFSSRRQVLWAWPLTAALLAYPLVYFVFGLLVSPFIQPYYVNGQIELTLPTWEQMIPLQLARSCLFLMVSLPVVAWWRGGVVRARNYGSSWVYPFSS